MTPSERRDPDEPQPSREPSDSDVDAAFARIVAGWDRAGESGGQPAGDPGPMDDSTPTDALPRIDPDELDAPPPAAAPQPAFDEDDDHYVPPDPPPFPRPQPATVGALVLVVIGIVLIATPGVLGFSEQYGLPLGLLSITGAIVWLVACLRQGPPTDSGWDDGAQV